MVAILENLGIKLLCSLMRMTIAVRSLCMRGAMQYVHTKSPHIPLAISPLSVRLWQLSCGLMLPL